MDYVFGSIGSKDIFKKLKKTKSIYIETGFYRGGGVEWALNNFDDVHSIELFEPFYEAGIEKFKGNSKVNLHLGDSKIKLGEILNQLNQPCFIVLDAHGDIKQTGPNPLYEELKSIKNNSIKNHTILIDDVRRIGDESDPCWSKVDIEELKSRLIDINNEYVVFEFKDILVACLQEEIINEWVIPYNQ